MSRKFAEIKDKRVHCIFETEDDFKPEFAPTFEVVEISDALKNIVKEGDYYVDRVFSEIAPEKEIITDTVKFTAPLSEEQRDKILIELAYKNKIEPAVLEKA